MVYKRERERHEEREDEYIPSIWSFRITPVSGTMIAEPK